MILCVPYADLKILTSKIELNKNSWTKGKGTRKRGTWFTLNGTEILELPIRQKTPPNMFDASINFSPISIKCFLFNLTFLPKLCQLFQPSKIISCLFFIELILLIELMQNYELCSLKSENFLVFNVNLQFAQFPWKPHCQVLMVWYFGWNLSLILDSW